MYNSIQLQQNFIDLNIENIEIPIPKNVQIAAEVGVTVVD